MRSAPTRDAARKFVREHMAANDLGAVVYTSGRSDAAQEFTTDRELLIRAIDKFQGRRMRSLSLDRLDAYYQRIAYGYNLRNDADAEYWIDQRAGCRRLRADVGPHGARARHARADGAGHVEEHGGVSRQRAWTPQGGAVLQRRARLSHSRRVRRARRHHRDSRDAGRDLDSGARQRQLLHDRSARPGRDDDRLHGIGGHRPTVPARPVRCCSCPARTRP